MRDPTLEELVKQQQRSIQALQTQAVGRPSYDPSSSWVTYTDAAFQSGISIGNGVFSFLYRVNSGSVDFDIYLRMGSSTSYGTDEVGIYVPQTIINTTRVSAVGTAVLADASAARIYQGVAIAGYAYAFVYALDFAGAIRCYFGAGPSQSMTPLSPITLATDDELWITMSIPGSLDA